MTTESINRAQAVVRRLREVGVPAAIVGGFARDSLYGRPIKDVDMAIEVGENSAAIPGFVEVLNRVLAVDLKRYDDSYDGDHPFIYAVYSSGASNMGAPIDAIFVSDIDGYVEEFSDDLSKVVLDGTAVDQYPESLADFAARRITYYSKPWLTPEKNEERIDKLLDKYEGFEVVSA